MNGPVLNPSILLTVTVGYFFLLFLVSKATSKKANNLDFFKGSNQSPWYIVAFGMLGASLSGVTFLSVPGMVHNTAFSYLQMVLGYGLGYGVIVYVLLPLYYKNNLISIYGYLLKRLGPSSQKTGAWFFILSRIIGASLRMYVVTLVLHDFIFSHYGVPYWLSVLTSLVLIWSYTAKAGIKTIIWTDTIQTFFMLAAIIITVIALASSLNLDTAGVLTTITNHYYSQMFFFEGGWSDENNFFKQFFAGALLAVVMTGLDQDMMQKNLSCKNLKESQKNIRWFYLALVVVNVIIMALGVLLYVYANSKGIELPTKDTGEIITDKVFPFVVFNHMPAYLGVVFLIGVLAAAYSSADSALTSLTTSYCVDIKDQKDIAQKDRIKIHVGFTLVLFFTIIIFKYTMESSVIWQLLTLAGYTYGPLLGMFAFGLFNKKQVKDKYVPLIAVLAPIATYLINKYSEQLFFGYNLGFERLLINAMLMYAGLHLLSKNVKKSK